MKGIQINMRGLGPAMIEEYATIRFFMLVKQWIS